MIPYSITLLFLAVTLNVFMPTANSNVVDEVQAVVITSYVNGIHNGGPIADIRQGFHESFVMFRRTDDGVTTTTISEWITSIENARRQNPGREIPNAEAKFRHTYVEGNSATVTLDLMRDGNTVFTDHILLYRFEDGWKMISKTFHRH